MTPYLLSGELLLGPRDERGIRRDAGRGARRLRMTGCQASVAVGVRRVPVRPRRIRSQSAERQRRQKAHYFAIAIIIIANENDERPFDGINQPPNQADRYRICKTGSIKVQTFHSRRDREPESNKLSAARLSVNS